MIYKDCLNDISIAKQALSESLLDVTVPSNSLIFEVYCLTSFNQTFYLQVYDGEQYTLLFAKPLLRTHHGLSSSSASFRSVVKAENHPAYRGDIYCGMKLLPKNNETISTLIKCLPAITEVLPESTITIDGNTTLIINHISNEPATLYFRNEASFEINAYFEEDARFLHNLYLHIEDLIGNLIRSSRNGN